MNTHALIATARYHGEVVQERFDAGVPVSLGGSPPLALPLPPGVDHLAHIEWGRRGHVTVTDALGRRFVVEPEETLEMRLGDVELDLELAPQFALRRTEGVPWQLSTGWLVMVLLFTSLTSWYETVSERRCQIFGITPELAVALGCVQPEHGGESGMFTAEYLARLLEEDYAGSEDGALQLQERPDAERESEHIYLPSGDRGPTDAMGGSEEVDLEVVKAPRTEQEMPTPEELAAKKAELEVSELPEEVGTPVEASPDDGIAEADDGEDVVDESTEDDGAEAPSEEKEGWGLQDWYDERDAMLDQLEIDYTKKFAEERLKIDPNDPAALSLLAHYQYLDEDYEGSESTYDRLLAQLPDDAAVYNNKALVYKRLGDYETEERLYRTALALEPLDVTAMNNLGVNLAHQKRFDEALAVMDQLQVLDPDDPYSDLHRAKIHAEMGNDEEAYRYLEKSLAGMAKLSTLHHIEYRQDIRVDPSLEKLRKTRRFRDILFKYYGEDAPVLE